MLGRIVLITGVVTLIFLIPVPLLMSFVNVPTSKYFAARHVLDALSVLLIMTPFYVGMNYLFRERLRFGRIYVAESRWKPAIAALEPFDSATQRFLDGTGEAHYLLAQAYSGAGDRVKAERIKTFVQKNRKGVWADKLKVAEPPRVSVIKASRSTDAPSNVEDGASQPDKFSRPTSRTDRPKSTTAAKRKKRF